MRLALFCLVSACALNAADTLKVFGRDWTVRMASDWKVDHEDGTEVLRLVQDRGPLPGPRRPIQFALTEVPEYGRATIDVDVKAIGQSLMMVFAYRDEAHFDYAHFSTDPGTKEVAHNGIFHVYGGERVRISNVRGPASFAVNEHWYHVQLTHDAASGSVSGMVEGKPIPALSATDVSLGAGKIGLGSFDEKAEFRNVKIQTTPAR